MSGAHRFFWCVLRLGFAYPKKYKLEKERNTMNKVEDFINTTKLNDLLNKKEELINMTKKQKKRKHQRLYGFLQSSVLLQQLQQQYMAYIVSLHQIIWKILKTILKMIMMTISSKMKRTKKSRQNQQRKKKKNKNNLEGCGCSPFFLCNR